MAIRIVVCGGPLGVTAVRATPYMQVSAQPALGKRRSFPVWPLPAVPAAMGQQEQHARVVTLQQQWPATRAVDCLTKYALYEHPQQSSMPVPVSAVAVAVLFAHTAPPCAPRPTPSTSPPPHPRSSRGQPCTPPWTGGRCTGRASGRCSSAWSNAAQPYSGHAAGTSHWQCLRVLPEQRHSGASPWQCRQPAHRHACPHSPQTLQEIGPRAGKVSPAPGFPIWGGGGLASTQSSCWRKGCPLKCRDMACQRLQELTSVLYPLENTTKLHKDMLLAQLLQRPAPGSRRCVLGGLRVCSRAQRAILGIGSRRKASVRAGRADVRFGERPPGDARSRDQLAHGMMFSHLWHVYTSLAEALPVEDIVLDASDPLVPAPGSAKESVAAFQRALRQSTQSGPGLESLVEPTEDMPVRYLPPGAKRDHWWTYVATCAASGGRPVGSYRTLCRVWKEHFSQILKISDYGKHPGCTTCARLKQGIQTSASYADKLEASKRLHDHHERVWRDRLVYWRMRSHAMHTGTRWLVIIADGADQAKFRVMKCVQWPKDLEGEHRPQMKVEGVWAHGRELAFNFLEEDVPQNTNVTIEVLTQALDRLLASAAPGAGPSAAPGTDFPAHLWVQMDNAGGENKNIHMSKWLAMLVDQGVFRSTVASYLQVGHTHEDIDSLFSIMSSCIAKMREWDSPMQMAEHRP